MLYIPAYNTGKVIHTKRGKRRDIVRNRREKSKPSGLKIESVARTMY